MGGGGIGGIAVVDESPPPLEPPLELLASVPPLEVVSEAVPSELEDASVSVGLGIGATVSDAVAPDVPAVLPCVASSPVLGPIIGAVSDALALALALALEPSPASSPHPPIMPRARLARTSAGVRGGAVGRDRKRMRDWPTSECPSSTPDAVCRPGIDRTLR
jgi:hypothetical protein